MNRDDGKELSPLWLSAMKRTQGPAVGNKGRGMLLRLKLTKIAECPSPTHLQANGQCWSPTHLPLCRRASEDQCRVSVNGVYCTPNRLILAQTSPIGWPRPLDAEHWTI